MAGGWIICACVWCAPLCSPFCWYFITVCVCVWCVCGVCGVVSRCFGETLSTLNFARRAKMIQNKVINKIKSLILF